jgi:hypothetical protein
MNWFSKTPPLDGDEGERDPPPPARSASDEYLEGLKFVAGIYEKRAESSRSIVKERAGSILAATNFERFESDAAEMRRSASNAQNNQSIAQEIRGWINDFEFQGYRPPHLPPLPSDTTPHESGE